MTHATEIERRKSEHIDLCVNGPVEGSRDTLLGDVHLMHDALPERAIGDVDSSVELLGKKLRAPILISGMTGGTRRAGEINRQMAELAQRHGFALGLGSQRAMLLRPELSATYEVRRHAPDVLVLANLGAVQARDLPSAAVQELAERVGADAICIHLNAAQELVQDEGDRDFGGCLDGIARLVEEIDLPVVAKETGCGFSPPTLARLRAAGVRWVDVAGAGGTTWTGVEALRGSDRQRALGGELREWGVPTAATLVYARRTGLHAIASGGIRGAHDVVRALALGASAAGLALPFIRALEREGADGLEQLACRLVEGVRVAMLLCGAGAVCDLRRAPRVLGPGLERWLSAWTPGTAEVWDGAMSPDTAATGDAT